MRRLTLYMQITVEGCISRAKTESDWTKPTEDEEAIETGLIDRVAAALIGASVYEEMANCRPAAAAHQPKPRC